MVNNTTTQQFTFIEKSLAWGVHLFTASGLVSGFMAILAINSRNWREAMLWLVLCLVIDGIDGAFARLFRVKEVLPYMDGKTIDYVIDFATYAIIPAYLFHQADLVSEDWRLPCTSIILLVSALYYGKEGMVSDDMYFIGFPVLWNMVVFYIMFVFPFDSIGNVFVVFFFAILHFMPVKFVYPSQGKRFRTLSIVMTVLFIGTLAAILWFLPERLPWLTTLAYLTAGYYAIMAVYNTWIEE